MQLDERFLQRDVRRRAVRPVTDVGIDQPVLLGRQQVHVGDALEHDLPLEGLERRRTLLHLHARHELLVEDQRVVAAEEIEAVRFVGGDAAR